MAEERIEVVYHKAAPGKRLLAHIIDIGLLFMSAVILFTISNLIVNNSGLYQKNQEALISVRNESNLYINNVDAVTYVSDDEAFPTYEAKKNELSTRINNFYHNSTYFSNDNVLKEYDQRKLSATRDSIHLFEEKDGVVVERSVDNQYLFDFYAEEFKDRSLAYLVNNPYYFNLTRFTFLTSIIEAVSSLTISFIIFYLVLPLTCFKRGRQTVGMKLEKVGIITVTAENESAGKYVLRFLFMFFVFVPINFVSFLIPSFVSMGMMYMTKTNSSLVNYVFNDYMVDVTNQKIYYSALEREEAQNKLKEISIENRDLRLK